MLLMKAIDHPAEMCGGSVRAAHGNSDAVIKASIHHQRRISQGAEKKL